MTELIDINMVKRNFKGREKDTNKGTFGTLTLFCGSPQMTGAAVLASRAAMRSGVGMVNLFIPKSIHSILASLMIEPVFTIFSENEHGVISKNYANEILKKLEESTACLVGCGLGQNEDTKQIVYEIIKNYRGPLIIDADGINAVSQNIDVLRAAKSSVILTPHPGEMSRLVGLSVSSINENSEQVALDFARENNVIIVLKGYETIVALPNAKVFKNTTGNPGMSTAGAGDVLAGMIGAFLAQGMAPIDSAISGVFLHGMAGDICAKELSEISVCATDIVNKLPETFLKM